MTRNMEALVWAMNVRGLSAGAWKLLVMMARRVGKRGFDVWPAHRTMAADAEMSVSSVRRYLEELTAARLIEAIHQDREDGGRSSNIYRLQVRQTIEFADQKLSIEPDDLDEYDFEDRAPDAPPPPVQIEHPPVQIEQGPLFTAEQGIRTIQEGTYITPLSSNEDISPQEQNLFGEPMGDDPPEPDLVDHVIDRWNELVARHPNIPKIRVIDESRRTKIRKRADDVIRAGIDKTPVEVWDEIFERIAESRFLLGQAPPGKDRTGPLRITIDFVLRPAYFLKILEGGFNDKSANDRFRRDGERMGPAEASAARVIERLRDAGQRDRRDRDQKLLA